MASEGVGAGLEEVAHKTKEAVEKTKQTLTVLWNDIEDWQRDNAFITSGYRPASNSYRGSASSLGYLHNESVNIWTHLLGAALAGGTGLFLYHGIRPRFHLATDEDVLVFLCFFAGAVACLGLSATYHTISNHSEAVAKFGNRLDYMGIVFLIWGSFIPSLYYGFRPDPALVKLYWTMITTFAAATLVVVLLPKLRTPEFRVLRTLAFVSMGVSAVIPVLHGIRLYGVARFEEQIALSWMNTQAALYLVGAAIFAARIPERWAPGRYDIFGGSHQIFHVLVVLAAAAHLTGLLKAFDHEHSRRNGVASV